MSKLWSQPVVVGAEDVDESAIVLTVNNLRRFLALLGCVVLLARPCQQVASRSQWWSPSRLQDTIVLSLECLTHVDLVLDRGHVVVVSAVLHERFPHARVVGIVTLDRELRGLDWNWLGLVHAHLLSEGLAGASLLFCELLVDLLQELSFEEHVLRLLLELLSMMMNIHFYFDFYIMNE